MVSAVLIFTVCFQARVLISEVQELIFCLCVDVNRDLSHGDQNTGRGRLKIGSENYVWE